MKNLLLIFVILISISCGNNTSKDVNVLPLENTADSVVVTIMKNPIIENDTSLMFVFFDSFECNVQVLLPDNKFSGTILMLHGWNLPAMECCEKTEFCQIALDLGYALIIPNLEKCNYPLELYPETLSQYQKYPTLTWIMDTLILDVNNQTGLLMQGQRNFVVGISTGGRGATLLAFYMPELFNACASLSGDFDITAMQDEFLYQAWFGDYSEFSERWENECFAYRCNQYNVPIYIGHGKKDAVSPVMQSIAMYDSIIKYNPELPIIGNFPDSSAHNYKYWSSESRNVLDFFETF